MMPQLHNCNIRLNQFMGTYYLFEGNLLILKSSPENMNSNMLGHDSKISCIPQSISLTPSPLEMNLFGVVSCRCLMSSKRSSLLEKKSMILCTRPGMTLPSSNLPQLSVVFYHKLVQEK